MNKVLFHNIKELLQVRSSNPEFVVGENMNVLPTIKNAYLIIKNDLIDSYGSMDELPDQQFNQKINATGKMILPTWCDSHTHLVYADSRENEFVDRINGLTYQEIANKGGGILNSAKKLQNMPEDDLFELSKARLQNVIKLGTGAIEIKSGYGLNTAAELKILRVIRRLKNDSNIPIKATFLAAHALPSEYKTDKSAYIDLIINEMMPKIHDQELTDFVDAFCEKGYFTTDDTHRIINAAKQYDWPAKIHVNQFNAIGGIQTAVDGHALSVDHLEVMTSVDIQTLKDSKTIPTALPACSYFLNIPYTPARLMISNGLGLALASDYNPGSCPSGNMNFVVSTACIKLNMTPAEAINAATINGAYAMNLEDQVGSITEGKFANLIMTNPIKSYDVLPYSFGTNLIDTVFIKGKAINKTL